MLDYLKFKVISFMEFIDIQVSVINERICVEVNTSYQDNYESKKTLSKIKSKKWLAKLQKLEIQKWPSNFNANLDILDGQSWSIDYKQVNKRCRHINGYMRYPDLWAEFLDIMAEISPIYTENRIDYVELNYENVETNVLSKFVDSSLKMVNFSREQKSKIIIDRANKMLSIIDSLNNENSFKQEIYAKAEVTELLEKCEIYFANVENKISDNKEYPQYELKIINHRRESIVQKGRFIKNDLPINYADFAEDIIKFVEDNSIKSNLLNKDFYNYGINAKVYIYCSVAFKENSKTYYYLTDDKSINVGDKVIVPIGKDNVTKIVTIEKIENFKEENVPIEINKVKKIIAKVN